jgi:hypothetical protein
MCVTVLFSANEIDIYVLKIFWLRGSIKCSLAGSLVKWFKYTDVAETSRISLMIETLFISKTLVYLNHLLQLSTRDFIEIDTVCHFWNQYHLSLLKSIPCVASEMNTVCRFWNRYRVSLLKSIPCVASEVDTVCRFWSRYRVSLLKSIPCVASEVDTVCRFCK